MFLEFGEPVDQPRYLGAKLLCQHFVADTTVFLDVVEQRRRERIRIELKPGDLIRYRERVGDVGLAGPAELSFVALRSESVGLAHDVEAVGGDVLPGALQDSFDIQRDSDRLLQRDALSCFV